MGKGTTIYIDIPQASLDSQKAAPSIKPVPNSLSTGHLLVVDDEPLIRGLLLRFLENRQFDVDLAEEGEEAWRKMQSVSYDCVILDMKMPGM